MRLRKFQVDAVEVEVVKVMVTGAVTVSVTAKER